jgi:WD40 repeat protein
MATREAVAAPATNPYVGPRSFLPHERLYGRTRELRDLTGLLIAERIVLLHSPSGAGKTSLMQAALIPALECRDFQVEPIMRVNTLAPPDLPPDTNAYVLSALLALNEQASAPLPLAELAGMTFSDYLDARDAAEGPDHLDRLLIFDQFEEILTVDPLNQAAKHAFFAQLGAALRDRSKRRWALFAMREDYLANLTPYLHHVPTRFKTTFRLDLLDPAGAKQAIQGPVQAAGHTFSDAAADALVNDLRRTQVQNPDGTLRDALGVGIEPVQLQVVCYRLWQRLAQVAGSAALEAIHVTPEDVVGVSNVDRSLADYYAEGVAQAAAQSGVDERDIRDWFDQKLITISGIRSQVLRGAETSADLPNSAITPLINAYLVRAEQRRGLTWFELAHDRLILPVRQDNADWYAHHLEPLQVQTESWLKAGKAESLLFRGQDLVDAEAWAAVHGKALRPSEQDFLAACAQLRAELEKELRMVRRLRLLTRVSLVTALLALLGLAAALVGYVRATRAEAEAVAQERIAEQQRNQAQARSYSAYALTQIAPNPELALILAREAAQISGPDGAPLPEARDVLWRTLAESRVRRTLTYPEQLFAVAYSPDGTLIASGGLGGVVNIYERSTGAQRSLSQLAADDSAVARLSFSPDGTRLAAVLPLTGVAIWDVVSGELLQTITRPGFISDADFSPDANTLAVANFDFAEDATGSAVIIDLRNGQIVREVAHGPGAAAVAFSADGTRLLSSGYDQDVVVTTIADGVELLRVGTDNVVTNLASAPQNGGIAAVERGIAEGLIFSTADPDPDFLFGHTAPLNAIVYSPDGSMIATSSEDQTVRLFAAASLRPVLTLRGFDQPIWQIAFHPDGTRLAVASSGGTITEWDVSFAFAGELTYATLDPQGRFLAVADRDGTVRVLNPQSGALLQIFREHNATITMLDFNADGSQLAVSSEDGTIGIWQVGAWTYRELLSESATTWAVRFHPDGQRLFTTIGGRVSVRDLAQGNEIAVYDFATDLRGMALSPDGSLLAIAVDNGELLLLDANTGTQIARSDATEYSGTVSFSPDGTRLAARTALGDVHTFMLSDPLLAQLQAVPLDLDQVDGFSFSSDSASLVLTRRNNTVAIADLAAGEIRAQVPEAVPARWALLLPDQRTVLSFGTDGKIRSYSLDTADLLARADAQITRAPTLDECVEFALPCAP